MNLLANARVHTPDGTRVVAELAEDREAGRATITVSDNGPGIPEELQATLFERFARGDSSRNRATGSTGLGLAIVHAVVEAHGGEVTVVSEPGATVFTVSLPVNGPAAVPPVAETAPAAETTAAAPAPAAAAQAGSVIEAPGIAPQVDADTEVLPKTDAVEVAEGGDRRS